MHPNTKAASDVFDQSLRRAPNMIDLPLLSMDHHVSFTVLDLRCCVGR